MKKLYSLFVLFFFVLPVKSQLPCTANFTSSLSGNNVSFFPNVSTSPDSLYIINHWWSFGDGSSSQLSFPSHTYAQCGTYTIYHITHTYDSNRVDICGDTITQTITISCNTPCAVQAYFLGSAVSGQSNTYVFVNSSTVSSPNTGTITSVWDFGDGETSTSVGLNNQTHTYSTSGRYRVCLSVYISQNPGTVSCSDSNCQIFQVVVPDTTPPCQVIPSFNAISSPNQSNVFDFTNTTRLDSALANVTWDFGDNTTGVGNHVTHTFEQSGDYTVCMHTTFNNSCTADTCISVHVMMPAVDSTTSTPLISYPNPAQSNVNVMVSLNQASSIYATVYNAQSRMVSQVIQAGNAGENVLSFNISNLPAGLYTIRIYSGNQVFVSRFQKL